MSDTTWYRIREPINNINTEEEEEEEEEEEDGRRNRISAVSADMAGGVIRVNFSVGVN